MGAEPRYYKDAMHNYMILESAQSPENYQYRMLAANHVEGLLPCSLRFIDGECLLYYEITSRQSVACLFERRGMEGREAMALLRALTGIYTRLGEYLLDRDNLLLRPEYIFYDFARGEFCFTYSPEPIMEENGVTPAAQLLEFMSEKTDSGDREVLGLLYSLCAKAENPNFLLTETDLGVEMEETGSGGEEAEHRENGESETDRECRKRVANREHRENCEEEKRQREMLTGGRQRAEEEREEALPGDGGNFREERISEKKKRNRETVESDRKNRTSESEAGRSSDGSREAEKRNDPEKGRKGVLRFLILSIFFLMTGLAIRWGRQFYYLTPEQELVSRAVMFLALGLAILCAGGGAVMSFVHGKKAGLRQKEETLRQELEAMTRTGEESYGGDTPLWKGNVAGKSGGRQAGGEGVLPERSAMAANDVAERTGISSLTANGGDAAAEPVFADEIYLGETECGGKKLYGEGDARKYRIPLRNLPCTAGRMAGYADYVIDEPSVSRLHARFSKEEGEKGGVRMTDLNSVNGTYLNGVRLEPNGSVRIEPGDEIRLGQLEFCYR